jgi:hypothetical protein
VVGLVGSRDTTSYAGGKVATGTVSHAGQVKADGSDEKIYPGPPIWLGDRLTSPRKKKKAYVEKTSKMPGNGQTNRRRSGYTRFEENSWG